jgi:hypothetical protein
MTGLLKRLLRRARGFLLQFLLPPDTQNQYPDAASQLQLQMTYRALADSGSPLPGLGQVGFKAYSQTDEDGILLYVFSIIGTTNKQSVEVCAGNGIECNTANLIVHHGWHGLLVDGSQNRIRLGQAFYRHNPSTSVYPPVLVQAWITRDNVNEVISTNGFEGEIDLLSIDMDGVDYWIWQAIHVIKPRVVVVEYQDIIGPDRAWTVPYRDDFDAFEYPTTRGSPNYCGASLPALVKLAREKGYRLVGCNRLGYNAFFIRDPIGERELPGIDLRECFKHPRVLQDMRERFPTVRDLPWVEV